MAARSRASSGSATSEHRHRRVVPAEARHGAAAPRTRAAQQGARVPCVDTPAVGGRIAGSVILEKRPVEPAVKDVSSGHSERVFYVEGCLRLAARLAVAVE